MILNERQFRITRTEARRISNQLRELDERIERADESDRKRWELLRAGGVRLLEQLTAELTEYEALRSGRIGTEPITSFDQLPLALIRARIAKEWTQQQLADAIGLPEQQIQRYEKERYRGASVTRVRKVAEVLGVWIAGSTVLPSASRPRTRPEWRKPLLMIVITELGRQYGRALRGRLELQKLMLLLDREISQVLNWSAYRFEPYRFGGYDPHLDDDVDVLVHHGFISRPIPVSGGDPMTEAGRESDLVANARTEEWTKTFLSDDRLSPREEKEQVATVVRDVVRRFGTLTRARLLELTYDEMPQFSSRSEIREIVERSIEQRRRNR